LIESYLRIVAWKKSKGHVKYWVLENVPNSRHSIKERYSWEELGLPGKGPDLEIPQRNIFNAADYGSPQTRKRFFCGDYPVPKQTHVGKWVTMRHVLDCLGNPLKDKNGEKIIDPVYEFSLPQEQVTDHFYDTRVADFEWMKSKRLKTDHGFMGKMSFPEELDRPSRTVMATRSASTREAILFDAGEGRYRLPTIREIASFMSFPINYQFEAKTEESKYRLVGNAVCCRMSAAVAGAMLSQASNEDIPDFVPLSPKGLCSVDLTSTMREIKAKASRRPDAKFSMHVPSLRISNMRAELTNKDSDFKSGTVSWRCKLYAGSGEGTKIIEVDNASVEKLLSQANGFDSFKTNLAARLSGFKHTPASLQEAYVLDDRERGPGAVLDAIRTIVDNHYPAQEYDEVGIDNDGSIPIPKKKVPIRVLASLYACNSLVESLRR
jgi:DNA (cytosine-5)-methyltransferase 1